MCWGDCGLEMDDCRSRTTRWPHVARWLACATPELVFFHRAPDREPRRGGVPSGVWDPTLEAGAASRSPCGVTGLGLNRSRRIVWPEDRHRGGRSREKRLRPRKTLCEKTEPPTAQRLTMKRPQNRLEKTKPLGRLDLRPIRPPRGAPQRCRPALRDKTELTVRQQLTTRNRTFVRPKGGVDKMPNPPGWLSINPVTIRTCDAKSEGHRPGEPVGSNGRRGARAGNARGRASQDRSAVARQREKGMLVFSGMAAILPLVSTQATGLSEWPPTAFVQADRGNQVEVCRSRPVTTPTRSASEVAKFFPRLRFGLVCDVSNLAGSGIIR